MLRIVTDSSAGLPHDLLEAYDIEVVPLKIHFGEATYREGEDLDNARFYQLLGQAEQLPTTSQPSAPVNRPWWPRPCSPRLISPSLIPFPPPWGMG